MKVPLLAVIRNSSILVVADSTPPYRFWDTEVPGSPDDLWDLETERSYWVKSRSKFVLSWCGQDYPINEGWQMITWQPWVMFEGGTYLNQAHWDWAVSVLERTGHDRLLGTCDVRLVKVLSEQGMINLVGQPLRGTFYQGWRALLFKDVPPDPPNTVFAEMIAHEARHMGLRDRGIFTAGWKRDELQAYDVSDLVHEYAGSGLDIFNNPAYAISYQLARTDWV